MNMNGILQIKKLIQVSCITCGNWFQVDEDEFDECECSKCHSDINLSDGWTKVKRPVHDASFGDYVATIDEIFDRR